MAIIGRIRNNAGLLILVIAIAMLAFLMMDALSSSSGLGAGNSIGTINGQEVSQQEYERRVQQISTQAQNQGQNLTDASRRNIREQAWTQYVQEILSTQEYDKLGIQVTKDEMRELLFSKNNAHPSIKNTALFQNESGQFDQERLKAFVSSFGEQPQRRQQWKSFEQQIHQDQLRQKYLDLVKKGIYAPKAIAQQSFADQNRKASVNYVYLPYSDVSDEEISFTDADLQNYINENPAKFKQEEESRIISYVSFPLDPSKNDSTSAENFISERVESFKNSDDEELFLQRQYSDAPYEDTYITLEQISGVAADNLRNLNKGEVYGPYYEDGQYKTTKVVDRTNIPDSVEYRQIYKGIQNTAQAQSAPQAIDSIKNVLDKGGDFEVLASSFSEGGENQTGGLIGYVQRDANPRLNKTLFFDNKVGDVFVHSDAQGVFIIEILNATYSTPAVKLATLGKKVDASEATRNAIYSQATQFASQSRDLQTLKAKAGEQNLEVQQSAGLGKNDFNIDGLGVATDIATWAFKNSVGDVSNQVFQINNTVGGQETSTYVVAGVERISASGIKALDDVRLRVETLVRNTKKAAKIKEQVGQVSALDAAATKMQKEVKTAEEITFSSASSSPDLGKEAEVLASIFGLKANTVSQPLEGVLGVFVAEVTSFAEAGESADISAAQKQVTQPVVQTADFRVLPALTKVFNVEDTRHKTRN